LTVSILASLRAAVSRRSRIFLTQSRCLRLYVPMVFGIIGERHSTCLGTERSASPESPSRRYRSPLKPSSLSKVHAGICNVLVNGRDDQLIGIEYTADRGVDRLVLADFLSPPFVVLHRILRALIPDQIETDRLAIVNPHS